MTTNLGLDDSLIEEAVKVGNHRTKEEAVTAALLEYVQARKRLGILDWVGKVDYDEDYDPKSLRGHSESFPKETDQKGALALPPSVRKLFWDTNVRSLRWDRHREAIIGRILAVGTWSDVTWLRETVGNPALREWFLRHEGRGLTPQQLRFWQLLLDLPRREVDRWLRNESRQVWDRRATP